MAITDVGEEEADGDEAEVADVETTTDGETEEGATTTGIKEVEIIVAEGVGMAGTMAATAAAENGNRLKLYQP